MLTRMMGVLVLMRAVCMVISLTSDLPHVLVGPYESGGYRLGHLHRIATVETLAILDRLPQVVARVFRRLLAAVAIEYGEERLPLRLCL